jgi:hypothetical protein
MLLRRDTTFSTSAMVACLMKPDELRRRRDSDEGCSVKLPICHIAMVEMETRRWVGLGWSNADFRFRMLYLGCMFAFELASSIGDFRFRMLYLGCMFAFELASSIGEYPKNENNGSDHCYRTDDLTFAAETASGSSNVAGSALADLPFLKAGRGYGQIAECRVFGVSSKGKITTKAKLIGRRSVAESGFLDDRIHSASWSEGR